MAISQNYPNIVPSLSLDFANVKALDPRITFSRASSATYYNANGLLESEASGVARFDHNPVTKESLGLLIEEQRTNLLLRSEEFDNAGWSKFRTSITANTVVAPDGSLTGDKVVEDTTIGTHLIGCPPNTSFVAGASQTLSIFVKKAGRSFVQLSAHPAALSNSFANFDLTSGIVTTSTNCTAQITNVGSGWFRCAITYVAASTITTRAGFFGLLTSGNAPLDENYLGNGFDGVFLWGAQFEQGSAFPTSYIPTSASQVTRAADAASMTGANFSSWYNAAEGSFFASMDYMSATTTNWVLAAHSGLATTTNDYLAFVKNATAFHRQTIEASGVSQGNLDIAGAVAGVVYKYAGCYKINDAAFTVDGATPLTDNTVNLPVPNAFQLGNLFNQYLNGHIRKISYYPVRVTNEQLQGLTT